MNGSDEMGERGSICSSVFIVGPGGPDGMRFPWAVAFIGMKINAPEMKDENRGAIAFMVVRFLDL